MAGLSAVGRMSSEVSLVTQIACITAEIVTPIAGE